MESSNNSNSQDASNRPPADRGSGNGGRGAGRDNFGGQGNRRRGKEEITGRIAMTTTTRKVCSLVESRR